MKPALNILYWPPLRYVSSHDTNIRVRFAKIRAEQKKSSDLARKETEANQASIQSIFDARRRGIKV